MSDDHEVGYRKPPKSTRFKKGRSGNPRGRPKRALNVKAELLAELAETILIREQGKQKKVNKLRAGFKAQAAKAVQGDTKAIAFLASTLIRLFDPDRPEQEQQTFDEGNLAIIEAFLKHQKKRLGG